VTRVREKRKEKKDRWDEVAGKNQGVDYGDTVKRVERSYM